MKTYDISRETKRFVYMEVVMFAIDEKYLSDIIDDRLHRLQDGLIVYYRGLMPLQAAKDMIKTIDISPYCAGYGVSIDGHIERRISQ